MLNKPKNHSSKQDAQCEIMPNIIAKFRHLHVVIERWNSGINIERQQDMFGREKGNLGL